MVNVICFLVSAGLLLIATTAVAGVDGRPWSEDVIYFALTDRFYDGDPANNVPVGSDEGLYDSAQKNLDRYHGGDFRGLELALQGGYFSKLGVTALWITPPVRNVWNSSYDAGDAAKTGYHGYWAQDFLDIDPHLTSALALDGTPYAEGREGRMQHYRDLVALAHENGIKVVQDVVCNHAGPVFYYDENSNGTFDRREKAEWIQPFRRDGFHGNALWADHAAWNQVRTAPSGPVEVLGEPVGCSGVLSRLEAYGRKGFNGDSLGKHDGEEMECDFFSLRDLWTDPGGAGFDALVDEFVRIYAFYIEVIGVDGLRIDTVKHVHHGFWDAFTERLRKRLGERAGDVILFGEVYDGNPEVLGNYTYRTDWPARRDLCLDGLLNFQFCWSARGYLQRQGGEFGNATGLERAMRDLHGTPEGGRRPYYNVEPGRDGLNSRQKVITFLENHDGLNRFRVNGVTERRNVLANAMVLLTEGIPCLYYGTEAGLLDDQGSLGRDSETGRMTFIRRGGGPRVREVMDSESFGAVRMLIAARNNLPVLRQGRTLPLWVDSRERDDDNGVFVFARSSGQDLVVVAFNLDAEERVAGGSRGLALVGLQNERLAEDGDRLVPVQWEGLGLGVGEEQVVRVEEGAARVVLPIPAEGVCLWKISRE